MAVVDIDAMIAAKNSNQDSNNTGNQENQSVENQTPPADPATPPANPEKNNTNPDQSIIKKLPVDQAENPTDNQSDDQPGNQSDDQGNQDEVEEDVDLREVFLNIDGEDKSASDLINERNEFAQRLAQIEKDDFLKGFIEHYLATGNAEEYLQAKAVDWDKKDDIEVLRAKFEAENNDLDPKIREKLWRRELADKYKVKPDLTQEELESEDYEIAQGLLKRDARNTREQFKATQSKFKIPERKAPEKVEQTQFDPNAYKQQLLTNKEVDTFVKTKLLKIEVSDEAGSSFGLEVEDANSVIEMMSDDRQFWKTFMNGNTVDRHKQAKVYAYAQDPEKFERALVEFGKTLAIEARLKEVKNTDAKLNSQNVDGAAEGSWSQRFGKAALQQKRQQGF